MAMNLDMPGWVSEDEDNKEMNSKSEIKNFLFG